MIFLNRTFTPAKTSIRSVKQNKMKLTLFTAILFSMEWMHIEGAVDGPPDCCLTVSDTRIPAKNILDYSIQYIAICPVRAVRFQTRKNKIICSDPDSNWAKNVMEILDRRKLTKEPSKVPFVYDTTANLIPTTPTIQRSITSEDPVDNWAKIDTNTANLISTTPSNQGIITEDGHPVSCCYTMTRTTKRIPSHLIRALKSHSKKGLHRVQMGIQT